MSDPDNKDQGKGFKGLQSLSSKLPEPPALPERKADTPALPLAWEEGATQQAAQPQPSQSQTAAPPWRGWVVALGVLGAIVFFFIWMGSQSSSSNSYSTPTAPGYRPSQSAETVPSTPSPGPSTTMPPVGDGLVLTSDQIRYCVFEDRRIKGAEKVVNNYEQASVNAFNSMVNDYNSRCGHFRYRDGDLAPIENEANTIQEQLEQEGQARMSGGQQRDATTAVKAATDAANSANDQASVSEGGPARLREMSPDQLREYASLALREQRLYAPAGNNAMEYYLALRDKSLNDPAVASTLIDLMPYTQIATEQSIAHGDLAEAQRLYALMEKVDPRAPALPRLKASITNNEASVDAATAAADAAAITSSARQTNGVTDQNSYVDSLGVNYQYEKNNSGAVLRSSTATFYLGKDCDVISPQYGNGTWSWANGGFMIDFGSAGSLGFPRQEIDAGNGANCQRDD